MYTLVELAVLEATACPLIGLNSSGANREGGVRHGDCDGGENPLSGIDDFLYAASHFSMLMDGQFMYSKTLWCAVCIWVIVAGCRTITPAGRAKVINEPPETSKNDSSAVPAVGIWRAPGLESKLLQASMTSDDSGVDLIPTATRESRAPWGRPDLGSIYSRTSKSDEYQRNPIIVIPGILGSKLVDESGRRVVWGEFGGNGIDPSTVEGARLLALPMGEGEALKDLTDTIEVSGPLDTLNVRVFGVLFQMAAYRDIVTALGIGGYRDSPDELDPQDVRCFQFAYDWRRDNVETAAQLHQFILEKKALVEAERQARFGDDAEPVRFDIVAHSMGGVMARYYLQYGDAPLPEDGSLPEINWKGAQYVDRLVMVAPPNAGSLQAVEYLTQGVQFSRFFSKYEPALLGTMPSVYQLLPRTRHRPVVSGSRRETVDLYDPQVWVHARWGFFNPTQSEQLRYLLPNEPDPLRRLEVAYGHLAKCLRRAERFHAAIDVKVDPPEGTTIHLIASDAHPTVFQYAIDNRGALSPTARVAGDGLVTRHSALMDERLSDNGKWAPRLKSPIKWDSVTFLFTDHLGLTKDPAFTDNVLYLLIESPR
ncbi:MULTISPECIES: lipase/acyltransferase domain-containing protein [unclassified Schlesneria]|uniref:lipase/acyltransferase domain-containing protein n=1 Tax=unclassified Schlesneria TaxID=2762017 RepID=UPI002F1B8287